MSNKILFEQLKAIIEGPLGISSVTSEAINEHVRAIQQNERRNIFGITIYRDGDDNYFVNDMVRPLQRQEVVQAVKNHLNASGRLLKEKDDIGVVVTRTHRSVYTGENIDKILNRLVEEYVRVLKELTGSEWHVVHAGSSILSFDSDETPKRTVDVYWEYEPGTVTATIYIEGPGGQQRVYARQRLSGILSKYHMEWIGKIISENIENIILFALDDGCVEVVVTDSSFNSLIEEIKGIIEKNK